MLIPLQPHGPKVILTEDRQASNLRQQDNHVSNSQNHASQDVYKS